MFEWLRRFFVVTPEVLAPPSSPQGEPAALSPETALLINISRLKELEAIDIMVPRVDIIGLDIALSKDEILHTIHNADHARFPVFNDDLDDVRGFIDIKYLFDQVTKGKPFDLKEVMHKPMFIAPSMRVIDLLVQMRITHVHLALVVDEYGGIDGLITIEDVIETIVGTLQDSTDGQNKPSIIEETPGRFLVDARTELPMLEQKLGFTLPLDPAERDEIDTVAGYISFTLGRVPARGEVVRVDQGLEVEILDADPRKIKWLKLTRVN
ncbi:MAG: hemolysin family protein [Holosporales bacterium]